MAVFGGGGGGGYNGGVGGSHDYGGGGGGGGSYVASSGALLFSQSGANPGNGRVTICYTPPAPPTIAKHFAAASTMLGATTTLSFTLTNPNAGTALSSVAFTDTLPTGLAVATPNGLTGSCGGGTITAVAGSSSIALTGGTLPANGTCTFSLDVAATSLGTQVNTTGAVTSFESGPGGTASATLAVRNLPPTISKSFGSGGAVLGDTTTLSFRLTNPNPVTALSAVAFADTLPAGLVVATPNGLSGSCGAGTITADAGSSGIVLAGGTLAANGTCTFNVNVTSTAVGLMVNTTSAVASAEGGTGGTASASLRVVAPCGGIQTMFWLTGAVQDFVVPAGVTSVTIVAAGAAGGPSSGSYPGGLGAVLGATFPVTPGETLHTLVGGAGGWSGGGGGGSFVYRTASAAGLLIAAAGGGGGVWVSAGIGGSATTAAADGKGCSGGSTAGVSGNGGAGGNPTSCSYSGPGGGGGGGGLLTEGGNGSQCSNGGAALVAGGAGGGADGGFGGGGGRSCSSMYLGGGGGGGYNGGGGGVIDWQSPAGAHLGGGGGGGSFIAAGGDATGQPSLSGANAGDGWVSICYSALATAAPTMSDGFAPPLVPLNGTSTLTFTITNPAANAVTLTGVAFTDTLPTGLTVATSSGTACGGALTTTAPTTIALSGASIGTGGQCQFSVTVTGATAGQYTNTTGAVTSTNGGTGNSATATLAVGSPDLTVSKSHTGTFAQGQTGAQYTITASNVGSAATDGTAVTVTDALPAGLTATAMSGSGWTCDVGTVSCTRSDALAAGTGYPPITLTVTVAANAPPSLTNTVTVAGGGDATPGNDTASDPVTITAANTPIPLLGGLGLALLVLVLVAAGAFVLTRRG